MLSTFVLPRFGSNATANHHCAQLRSFNAMMTTQLSGAMGGFVWSLIHFMYTGKWSLAGFVCGSISGLVAISAFFPLQPTVKC